MSKLLDKALQDFPASEIWRLQTDGWQAPAGPLGFSDAFLKGMDAGFDFLRKHGKSMITPELIEGIYVSAYQYETEYGEIKKYDTGYGTGLSGFELYLPYAGIEHPAGVSLAGLDELATRLEEIYQAQGDREHPQLDIQYRNRDNRGFFKTLAPKDFASLEAFKTELEMHLGRASGSKDRCLGPKTPEEHLTIVRLISYPATRAEVLGFVNRDIQTYYAELGMAKRIADPEYRKAGEINAINRFVRTLHQSHYFPDGNGRTFVFLLANLLLLQNGHGLKITFSPAHYAAYSSHELLSETMADLAHFQSWKITAAKEYMSTLSAGSIINDPERVYSDVSSRLNPDPLVAIAQINELFVQITNSKFPVPASYKPRKGSFLNQSMFSKHSKSEQTAHIQVLSLLKRMYLASLEHMVQDDHNKDENTRMGAGSKNHSPAEVLSSIVARQQISLQCNSDAIWNTIAQISGASSSGPSSSSAAS